MSPFQKRNETKKNQNNKIWISRRAPSSHYTYKILESFYNYCKLLLQKKNVSKLNVKYILAKPFFASFLRQLAPSFRQFDNVRPAASRSSHFAVYCPSQPRLQLIKVTTALLLKMDNYLALCSMYSRTIRNIPKCNKTKKNMKSRIQRLKLPNSLW